MMPRTPDIQVGSLAGDKEPAGQGTQEQPSSEIGIPASAFRQGLTREQKREQRMAMTALSGEGRCAHGAARWVRLKTYVVGRGVDATAPGCAASGRYCPHGSSRKEPSGDQVGRR